MTYNVISTGSKGNAVIINDELLIDCGVPFTAIEDYFRSIKAVLLTHIHGDHFNRSTLRKLASKRPTLRFVCCEWLVGPLLALGISPRQIDRLEAGKLYDYKKFKLSPFRLYHNVENCGWRIFTAEGEKILYATDTNTLEGVEAKNYDLYLVEANYEDEEIRKRIEAKDIAGAYAYERQVLHNHMSQAMCDDFLLKNMGPASSYIYMHGHQERKTENEN